MDTKVKSFVETKKLRLTEKEIMRLWFQEHPNEEVCRADVEEIIGKPTNHCTRILFDLVEEGSIVVAYVAPSKYTGKTVNFYRFSSFMYEPQPKPQHETLKVEVRQLTLF